MTLVDFHRLCEVSVGFRRLSAQPYDVEAGDCFQVDIHPPVPIQPFPSEVDNALSLMGRNPVLVRSRFDDQPPLEPDESVSPNSPIDGEWSTIIIFNMDREGIVGRITSGSLDHFYNQAAGMIG